jgi:hypothetical protein
MQITGQTLTESPGIPMPHAALMDDSPDKTADYQYSDENAAVHDLILTSRPQIGELRA